MAWNISNTNGFLSIVFTGTISDQDLSEAMDRVVQIEGCSELAPHRISDLSGAEGINLTFQSIMALVRRRQEVPLANRIKSAVVASQSLQFGFARMFQTLNDHPMVTVQIFRTHEEALAWIRE